MTKFKVDDRVRVLSQGSSESPNIQREGQIGVIGFVSSTLCCVRFEKDNEYVGSIEMKGLELITTKENKPMARRTYKQIRETPGIKKGAIFQEQCDDGTQPYEMITPQFIKGTETRTFTITDRKLIEEQPEWFVEVFKVEPEYMTKEELDRYHEFLGKKKPTTVAKTTSRKTRPGRHVRTPEMRAAQAKRMKAFYARKRRQAR